jgi:hypothetical protein
MTVGETSCIEEENIEPYQCISEPALGETAGEWVRFLIGCLVYGEIISEGIMVSGRNVVNTSSLVSGLYTIMVDLVERCEISSGGGEIFDGLIRLRDR